MQCTTSVWRISSKINRNDWNGNRRLPIGNCAHWKANRTSTVRILFASIRASTTTQFWCAEQIRSSLCADTTRAASRWDTNRTRRPSLTTKRQKMTQSLSMQRGTWVRRCRSPKMTLTLMAIPSLRVHSNWSAKSMGKGGALTTPRTTVRTFSPMVSCIRPPLPTSLVAMRWFIAKSSAPNNTMRNSWINRHSLAQSNAMGMCFSSSAKSP